MKARGETLSQSEIEALLASIPAETGVPAAPAALPNAGRKIRTWDFRKPDKFAKDHLRSLLALHQSFARLASSALSARLRSSVTIRVTSVDQGLYEEYIDLLPSQGVINVVSLKPLDGSIVLELQPELALVMLDRLLGGAGELIHAKHELTDIEIALIRNLGRTLLEALRESWLNLAEVDPAIEEISTSPQLVQVTSPTDIVVIVLLEVQIGERLGTISICVPHLVLEPVMQRLSAQVWVSNRRRVVSPELRDQIATGLRRAPVRVTAVLGETAVTIDEVLNLSPGDVLVLGRGAVKNVKVKIGDQQKFTGTPGILGGRMAVKITAVEEAFDGDH